MARGPWLPCGHAQTVQFGLHVYICIRSLTKIVLAGQRCLLVRRSVLLVGTCRSHVLQVLQVACMVVCLAKKKSLIRLISVLRVHALVSLDSEPPKCTCSECCSVCACQLSKYCNLQSHILRNCPKSLALSVQNFKHGSLWGCSRISELPGQA